MAVTDARFEEREEDVPLLNDNGDDEDTPLLRAEHQPTPHHLIHETHSRGAIIAILFVVIFTLMAGGFLLAVPTMRVYEQIICQHYYNDLAGERHVTLGGQIDEAMCKREAVQKELNIVIAGEKFIGAIPALLLTVPYGLMMDRIGRKPVLILSLFGVLMVCLWNLMVMWFWRSIPLRAVWIAPLFSIIGGGEAVAGMATHTIAADVTTESNRSNVFFITRCAGLLAELIMPSVASALMAKSPWIPLLLGAGTVIFGTALIPFIPETLHLRAHSTSIGGDVTPDSSSERSIKLDDSTFYTATKSQILDAARRLAGSVSIIRSPRIALLLMTFIVAPFSNQSVDLSVRYVSNRFNWTLASAGYLISLRALINIILFLGILPSLSHFFTARLNKTAYHKDLLLAKFSILVLVVGAFVIAASNTIGLTVVGLMIWTLGTGFVSLIRALITALVDQEHIGRLNSVVAIVESGGELIAGPLLATVYTIGLELQGAWVGLPFFLLSGVCLIGVFGIWTFGLVGRREGEKGVGYRVEEEIERRRDNSVLVEVDRAEYGVINVL